MYQFIYENKTTTYTNYSDIETNKLSVHPALLHKWDKNVPTTCNDSYQKEALHESCAV